MQKIETIEIKNFKSIRHQKIEGCKRINVFIGYPNVGKSNILEALSLYGMNNMDTLLISDVVRLENNPNIFFNGNIEKDATIRLNSNVEMILSYQNGGKVLVKCAEVGELNKLDHYIFRFEINKDSSFVEPISKLEFDFTEKSFFGNILKYNFKKDALAKSSGDDFMDLSAPFGNNLYSFIQYNSELKNEVNELLKEYSLSLIFDQGSQMMKVVKKISDENVFIISFNLLADTLLRLIFYKAAILGNKNSILIFEEPESHMFPPYIAKLTSDIIFDENNNQYFIATHSPYVLNEFIEEAQNDLAIYLVDYDKGETVIKRLTDEQVSEVAQYGIDLFFNLETYLDKYEQPHSA